MKKIWTVISILVVLMVAIVIVMGNPFSETASNQRSFKKQVSHIGEAAQMSLNDVTTFEWDKVYSFVPYTSKDEIAKIIGFNSNEIQETVNEGMEQLLFVKDNRVVFSICGYASNLKFSVHLGEYEGRYICLYRLDNPLFDLSRSSDIITLTYIAKK